MNTSTIILAIVIGVIIALIRKVIEKRLWKKHIKSINKILNEKINFINKNYDNMIIKFSKDIERYPFFDKKLTQKAINYFANVLSKLNIIFPDFITYSLTDSNSIYFKFSKNEYTINLEIFYDYNGSNDDIECIITISKDDVLILKEFGNIEEIFNIINKNLK